MTNIKQLDFQNKILFRAHVMNKKSRCFIISNTNTTSELYDKIDEQFFPVTNFEDKDKNKPIIIGYHENPYYDEERTIEMNNRIKYKIYSYNQTTDKYITFPNSNKITIEQFIVKNNKYFEECKEIKTIHPIYKIYIIDDTLRKFWYDFMYVKPKSMVVEQFQRLTNCFIVWKREDSEKRSSLNNSSLNNISVLTQFS
jgi:hypothetical protein